MFAEILQDLKYQIKIGGFWIRVILLCVLVFIIVNISNSYFQFSNINEPILENPVLKYLALSSDWRFDMIHIWLWVSHIFTHQAVFHILFNMLNLYWFGMIVEDLIGKKHAITIFFEAGILGGIFFLIAANLLPWYQNNQIIAYGTSSSVMGLILAAATISPNYNIRLILIGNVAIKYIALTLIVLDLLFVSQVDNSGGHAAHIGGALLGYLYIIFLRNGISFSPQDWLPKKTNKAQRTPNRSMSSNPNNQKVQKKSTFEDPEHKLNRILEKIKNKGIQTLSEEERQFLDQEAQK